MERRKLIEKSIEKEILEVNPIVAIPYASSVYSISLTKGPKWLFTGGEDGLIRKFDFFQSVEGKSLLTVSQRHQLIDSILFNGMICSYWENEIPFYKSNINSYLNSNDSFFEPNLSPVYSLCCDLNGFWLLSGLKNGSITLQSIRSSEGTIQWYFKNANDKNLKFNEKKFLHSDTVSCLITNSNQSNFLSGSWDKKILKWDLNNGKNLNIFNKSTGQISSLQYRPIIGTDINWKPITDDDDNNNNDNNTSKSKDDDDDMDSLFGDDDENEEEEKEEEENKEIDNKSQIEIDKQSIDNPQFKRDIVKLQKDSIQSGTYEGLKNSDDIFLSSSINGSINIWDSRMNENSNCVCKIPTLPNTPPWCTSATWSVDGDSIFVGRRNSTIENFDIRYPTKISKLLKFPNASGSISCVRTLPNKNYILCGCQDNIRLYDLRLYESTKNDGNSNSKSSSSKIPFTIIPGHNGGILSDLYVDPTCRFLVSASGNRGWQGKPSDFVYIYEFL